MNANEPSCLLFLPAAFMFDICLFSFEFFNLLYCVGGFFFFGGEGGEGGLYGIC